MNDPPRGGGDHPEPDDDEGPRRAERPPPHPLDRVWRHPSEVGRVTPVSPPPRPRRNASVWAVALVSAAAGTLVTVAVLAATGAFAHDRETVTVHDRLGSQSKDDALAKAAAAVRRSVVEVTVRDRWGLRRATGICVRHGGDILTTSAVIARAKTAAVLNAEGERLVGTVVGVDPISGLALLHVEGDVPAATFASRAPKAGDSVFAVGAGGWLSDGRINDADVAIANRKGITMQGLLATSVHTAGAAHGGGDALVDRTGAIAGVVLTNDGTAVPAEYAARIADELQRKGWVAHAWAGIEGGDGSSGALVSGVAEGGPAAKAGLKAGDVIVAVDGRAVAGMAEVMAVVHAHWPGDTVRVTVQRAKQQPTLTLAVTSAP